MARLYFNICPYAATKYIRSLSIMATTLTTQKSSFKLTLKFSVQFQRRLKRQRRRWRWRKRGQIDKSQTTTNDRHVIDSEASDSWSGPDHSGRNESQTSTSAENNLPQSNRRAAYELGWRAAEKHFEERRRTDVRFVFVRRRWGGVVDDVKSEQARSALVAGTHPNGLRESRGFEDTRIFGWGPEAVRGHREDDET